MRFCTRKEKIVIFAHENYNVVFYDKNPTNAEIYICPVQIDEIYLSF